MKKQRRWERCRGVLKRRRWERCHGVKKRRRWERCRGVGWEGEAAANLVGEASDPLDGERRDWPALEGAVRSVAVEADGHADPDL